jgi:hypothetical protein
MKDSGCELTLVGIEEVTSFAGGCARLGMGIAYDILRGLRCGVRTRWRDSIIILKNDFPRDHE